MAYFTLFMGSYTQQLSPDLLGIGDGIYTVQLNDETGELKVLHTMNTINPSYLAISNDNRFLYCHTEVSIGDEPKVQAYKIKDDFSLELLNEQPIAGGYPCHIAKFDDNILVACYETGNILQFPLDQNGKLMKCAKNHQHVGSSINKKRQEGPHAHQVVVHPNRKEIYACDLGLDIIKAYGFQDKEYIANTSHDIVVAKGGGPRHMVFNENGTLGYVLNELSGAVSILKKRDGSFKQIDSSDSLPHTYKGMPSSSAIRIHPNNGFLYAANRTLDAITIFEIKGEKLEVIDCQFTEGNELREFNITPDGKWLIACHQNSHDTVVYQIKSDGKLTKKYRTKNIKTPVCIAF